MMNASKNASTTTPMITPTQAPEIRVRPVGLPGAGAVSSGPLGTSARREVVPPSVPGAPSLITSPPRSVGSRVSMRSVLGAVDHVSDLVLHLLDLLFDFVLCVADLLFGLTSLTICLAFGLKVLVARQASDSLFRVALRLLSLSCHRGSPFLVVTCPIAEVDDQTFPVWRCSISRARGVGPCALSFRDPRDASSASSEREGPGLRGGSLPCRRLFDTA